MPLELRRYSALCRRSGVMIRVLAVYYDGLIRFPDQEIFRHFRNQTNDFCIKTEKKLFKL